MHEQRWPGRPDIRVIGQLNQQAQQHTQRILRSHGAGISNRTSLVYRKSHLSAVQTLRGPDTMGPVTNCILDASLHVC